MRPPEFDPSSLQGLTHTEAARRLREQGPNELPSTKPRPWYAIALNVVREPMFLLLLGASAVYFIVGDNQEAAVLTAFVVVVISITFFQERKTERALEALRDLSSPRASVIREGQETRIAGREVVSGDLVVLREGDRVPADGLLAWARNLSVDESLLTGESAAVRKQSADGETTVARPGGEDLPAVYAGTLVVRGQGVAEIKCIGAATEIGLIGKALLTLEPEDTALQQETNRVVKVLAAAGLALCVVVVVLYGSTRGDWMSGLLAGIALAMAILPEELPVILTVFLALGAWRISKSNVLTRRVPAVEALGAASVLCVDKTGTITQNKMAIARVFAQGETLSVDRPDAVLPETFHELLEFGILASQRDPFDPMEKAIRRLGAEHLTGEERRNHIHDDWQLVREYPLSPDLLALSHVWRSPDGEDFVIAAKGSPEAVFDLCHLPADSLAGLSDAVERMAHDGLRVLGVAKASFARPTLPGEQHAFDFAFVGLLGFADPVRPGVAASVRECHEAGIRVVMITGDYPATAQSIATQIGLAGLETITGSELAEMDDAELRDRAATANIFARVVPEQKLRIVNAFKARGDTVAMTGDGVNDAPALKAAHIGVAMGGRGTDVARESGALVLLDDDFTSIVAAVRLGRGIFSNIRKAVAYALAIHIPIIGLTLLPVLMGWPLALLPVHIALLELIIDPACSVVFEAEPSPADIMRRPPRAKGTRLFDKTLVWLGVGQGLVAMFIVALLYGMYLSAGADVATARTVSFVALIALNVGMIFTNRSWKEPTLAHIFKPNRAFWILLITVAIFLVSAVTVPPIGDIFDLTGIAGGDHLVAGGSALAGILLLDAIKRTVLKRQAA